jgi:ribose 5-phosphate isomerase B
MSNERIAIGSDHAGYTLKAKLKEYVLNLGYDIHDLGTYNSDSTDYPVYGKKVGEVVSSGRYDLGIVICGTGIGISIAANKVPGVRAANVTDPLSAALSRRHNNANVLAFGARIVGPDLAKEIVRSWLTAKFEGGRHSRRVNELIAEDERDYQKFNALFASSHGTERSIL